MDQPQSSNPGGRVVGACDENISRGGLRILESGAAQVLPEGGLAAKLATAQREGRPLRVKFGIDPSGTRLTLGHAVVLRKLRQFQDLGHIAVLLIGDFTGQVGDPTGKLAVRSSLSAEETARNSAGYLAQVMRILDPARTEIRHNAEWLSALTMADVLREARNLTVARLLERDDFARRHAAGTPITLMEFLYPMLQGYDSVATNADVELGGTDQTYNNLVGRDLQRAHGQDPQVVLTMPLLEGTDGAEKMGKSLGNWIGIDESPDEQFGKLMSIPDTLTGRYAELCTDLHPDEVLRLRALTSRGGPDANRAKRAVARAVVRLYHGQEAADVAEARFDAVFRMRQVPADAPESALPPGDPVSIPALLVALGFATSRNEARRLVQGGAVRLDGVKVPADCAEMPRAGLAGKVVSAGRRRQARVID